MFVKDVHVNNVIGLHARPSTMFCMLANEFNSDIFIEKNGRRVRAKVQLDVLSLNISGGDDIRFIADGEDEQTAVEMLCYLMDCGYSSEAYTYALQIAGKSGTKVILNSDNSEASKIKIKEITSGTMKYELLPDTIAQGTVKKTLIFQNKDQKGVTEVAMLEVSPNAKILPHSHDKDHEIYYNIESREFFICLMGGIHELENNTDDTLKILSVKIVGDLEELQKWLLIFSSII